MRRKRIAAAAITCGLAGTAILATGSPASAVNDYCVDNGSGAATCFHPQGDWFMLYDAAKDGHTAVLYWETDYGRSGKCAVAGFNNQTDCDYNFREGHEVYFRVGEYDGDTGWLGDLSRWTSWTA